MNRYHFNAMENNEERFIAVRANSYSEAKSIINLDDELNGLIWVLNRTQYDIDTPEETEIEAPTADKYTWDWGRLIFTCIGLIVLPFAMVYFVSLLSWGEYDPGVIFNKWWFLTILSFFILCSISLLSLMLYISITED